MFGPVTDLHTKFQVIKQSRVSIVAASNQLPRLTTFSSDLKKGQGK